MDKGSHANNQSSEIVIGLVGAVGTNLDSVVGHLKDHLTKFSYKQEVIRLSVPGKYKLPENGK